MKTATAPILNPINTLDAPMPNAPSPPSPSSDPPLSPDELGSGLGLAVFDELAASLVPVPEEDGLMTVSVGIVKLPVSELLLEGDMTVSDLDIVLDIEPV
jgi:hypothetical protein